MRFKRVKCKIQGQGNPWYLVFPRDNLGNEEIESNSVEKDMGVLVDEKLGTIQHLQLKKPNVSCAAAQQEWPAGRGR